MSDLPAGWTAVAVALLTVVGGIVAASIAARRSRMAQLELENRRLWFALRGVVDVLYRNGIPIPDELELIIHPREDP